MPNIYTGRNLTITIDSVAYSAQVTAARLIPSQNTNQYITLTSSGATKDPVTWTLEVTGFQDWTNSTGMSDKFYDIAVTGTAVTFSLGLPASRTASGSILPVFPEMGGEATAALEGTISFPVDGAITLT